MNNPGVTPEWKRQIKRRANWWLPWAVEEFGDTLREVFRKRDIYDLGSPARRKNIRDVVLYFITMAISVAIGVFAPKLPIPAPFGPEVLPRWALEVIIIIVIYLGWRLIAQQLGHPDFFASDASRNWFVIPALFWAGIIGVILVHVSSQWFPPLWCLIGVIVLYLIAFISGLLGMPMKRAQKKASKRRTK